YYLGGKCNGAMIALEMARRLRHRGKDVRFVGLVHGWAGTHYMGVKPHTDPPRKPHPELLSSRNYQRRKAWAYFRYLWAMKVYTPQPYSGKVSIFWPEGIPYRGDDST